MRASFWKNLAVLVVAGVLTALGAYNIVLKATWSMLDDGVFWRQEPEGLVARQIAPGGPGQRAGVREGDILLAVDGRDVLDADGLERLLADRPGDQPVRYSLLRADERRALELTLKPLGSGNVTLFYYLSVVGFFSLGVGTIVMLRRPGADRAALHFYAICLLFFLMYSTSYTGKLNWADWTLLWTDHLAILFLPVVFLHFCLSCVCFLSSTGLRGFLFLRNSFLHCSFRFIFTIFFIIIRFLCCISYCTSYCISYCFNF